MYLNEWGPIAWELFHYITYTYKSELKEYYTIFFSSLYSIIPCPHCSNDIKGILTSHLNYPTHHTINREDIINWYIKVHNIVNKKLKTSDTFNRSDADNKYVKNNVITIDHVRILQFIKLAIVTKGNNKKIDSDIAFQRNIIALCCIYPTDIDQYNPHLMYFINYSNITNKSYNEWYKSFEQIVLNKQYYKKWNNVKYPIRDLTYNEQNLKHLELFSGSTNKIFDTNNKVIVTDYPNNKYSSIVVSSTNTHNVYVHKSYVMYNNINSLFIHINGRSFSKNGCINIKTNISTPEITNIKTYEFRNNDSSIIIEYSDLKQNTSVNILFEFINKIPDDNFIINDICLIGI